MSIRQIRDKVTIFGEILTLLMAGYACRPADSNQSAETIHLLTPAFYHWKTTFDPTPFEKKELARLGVVKLYVHYFDIDWDARARQARPKAFVQFRQKPPVGTGDRSTQIVPVVFITNQTLLNLPPAQLPALADSVARAIGRISTENGIRYNEAQFDCDWSGATRRAYFDLLQQLKAKLHCPLSATIRLHQIKYADRTGVPPVQRGMLMLYNVGDWKRPDTRNSIYDPDVVKRYLPFVRQYPLPLDAVLPLFRWTIVYRSGQFLVFLNNIDRRTLAGQDFLEATADTNRFVARRDTIAFGMVVRRGDYFRAEAVSPEMLLAMKQHLLAEIQNRSLTFALYHLDSATLAAYPRATIPTLFQTAHP